MRRWSKLKPGSPAGKLRQAFALQILRKLRTAGGGKSSAHVCFFHDLTHEFPHVDGKIFHTLKALMFAPGLLTADYWSGRIASWVRRCIRQEADHLMSL
ncbi:MAG: DUF3667 domain-containing protein [Bryobacterales bacterium]|nr:DUF3667 domain-containing protein [Bryobacterales bacterium]MBV9397291.1 DUF3667 domain-containing protein [Bryobacterales bacterium]